MADPEFMWVWLRAHAASFYGRKPLVEFTEKSEYLMPKLTAAIGHYLTQTSTHWGQGKLNPATIAWLLCQVEQELENSA